MAFQITKEMLVGSLMPVVVYWVYGGLYTMLGYTCNNYRLHPKEDEDDKNFASKQTVIRGVLFQQFRQFIATNLLYMLTRGNDAGASSGQSTSLFVIARQFIVAMFVFDTYQYFVHRYLHQNKFLYKHLLLRAWLQVIQRMCQLLQALMKERRVSTHQGQNQHRPKRGVE
ncbi:hypothetical protein V6N12_020509 [Hibiscus sabdariffa]|uniref:Uncharacterized protein n=1 Tax=Hibiscus sabdariffa TaxID=183260 RepID=A0ABR2CYB2_9ROSI